MEVELPLHVIQAKCPGCDTSLQQLPHAAGLVAGCFGCGGLWLDNSAARAFVNFGVPPEVVALTRALPGPDLTRDAKDQGYRKNARTNRACPTCEALLDQRTFRVTGGKVELDVCGAHGTFFDPNELAALSGGFMMAKHLADPLQAEADRLRDSASPTEVDLSPLVGTLLTFLAQPRPRR